MSQARIDQNDKSTWLAYNETTGLVENVRVDPVTNALLIYIERWDGTTPTALNRAKIDANEKQTVIGYNETSGLIEAMRCTTDGYLLVKAVS